MNERYTITVTVSVLRHDAESERIRRFRKLWQLQLRWSVGFFDSVQFHERPDSRVESQSDDLANARASSCSVPIVSPRLRITGSRVTRYVAIRRRRVAQSVEKDRSSMTHNKQVDIDDIAGKTVARVFADYSDEVLIVFTDGTFSLIYGGSRNFRLSWCNSSKWDWERAYPARQSKGRPPLLPVLL
jgi:hypothetical protein